MSENCPKAGLLQVGDLVIQFSRTLMPRHESHSVQHELRSLEAEF
jgi:hypothetical protein